MCNTVYAIYIIYIYTHKYCIFIGWPRKSGVLVGIIIQISPSWPPVYHSHQSKKRNVCLTAAWGGECWGFSNIFRLGCVFIQVGFSTDFLSIAGGIRLGCSHITYHRVLLGAMGKSSGCWPFFFPERRAGTRPKHHRNSKKKHGEAVNDKWCCIDDMRLHKQRKFSEFQLPAWICSRPWFIVAKCDSYWRDLNAMLSAAKASCSDSLSHAVCPLAARHSFNCVLSGMIRQFFSQQAQSMCKSMKIGWLDGNLPFHWKI